VLGKAPLYAFPHYRVIICNKQPDFSAVSSRHLLFAHPFFVPPVNRQARLAIRRRIYRIN